MKEEKKNPPKISILRLTPKLHSKWFPNTQQSTKLVFLVAQRTSQKKLPIINRHLQNLKKSGFQREVNEEQSLERGVF